jgi:glycerol uptake facilitator-like aquaporin
MLYGIITVLGPISGAHFNPAVTLFFLLQRDLNAVQALAYILCQIIGAVLGVWAAHLMFDLQILQVSTTDRASQGLWASEIIATFGLLFVIVGGLVHRAEAVPALVAFYITGAYWFTSSTSFANPAVTIARGWSDTFAGINPAHIPMFLIMQVVAVGIAGVALARLFSTK